MDINRNQWFMAGLVLLFMGIQFRAVDSFVLTPEFTELVAGSSGSSVAAANAAAPSLGLFRNAPPAMKTVTPPEWLGWALLSIGLVLGLHSMAMKKPEGA